MNEQISEERAAELRAGISVTPWNHDGRGRISINTKPFRMEIVRLSSPSITETPNTLEENSQMRADYDFIAAAPAIYDMLRKKLDTARATVEKLSEESRLCVVNARRAEKAEAELARVKRETWDAAITIVADPYGDEVQVIGEESPRAVSNKMVAVLTAARDAEG